MRFNGDFHHVSGLALAPLPVQRPIPLWFGGASPEHKRPKQFLLERMARLADGWYLDAGVAPNDLTRETFDELRRLVDDAGRSTDDFGIDGRLNMARVGREDVTEVTERWRALRLSHLTIDTRDAFKGGWETSTGGIDILREVVAPVREAAQSR